jgi:MarC family membrane protein
MMESHFQAIATVFSLVNPVVCAVIFSSIAEGQDKAAKVRLATSGMAIVAVVLLIAAFLGSHILKIFGISLDAFSVAGGIVLAFIGFGMVSGAGGAPKPDTPAKDSSPPSLGRLVLFAASPGTITGVITIASQNHGKNIIPAVVSIVIVVAVTWALLYAACSRTGTGKTPGLGRDMVSRYMGLIIIAMGIQFALTGFKAFMAG